jgi:hypothetical protein
MSFAANGDRRWALASGSIRPTPMRPWRPDPAGGAFTLETITSQGNMSTRITSIKP